MNKSVYIFMAVLALAGCVKEVPDSGETSVDRAITGVTRIAKAGENIQITVTLPKIKGLETRVSLSENNEGGFDPTWEDGDMILVGGETFTLVSHEGKKGVFSGKMPEGDTFDIICPAKESEATTQKADKDYSHIRYHASMTGVNSIEDIDFSYAWAGKHGGRFSQSGCLKVILNLPSGTSDITSVSIYGEGFEPASLNIGNGGLTGNTFTAYIPCGKMELDRTKEVTIKVTTTSEEELTNTFFPGTQVLYEGYLVKMATSNARWQRVLTGKGSEHDPYLIRSLAELNNVRNLISKNTTTYFRMTADIDMSSIKDWTPINLKNEPYGIVFDGGGNKIAGFTCTHKERASFFGILHGTVKNLIFEDATVTTSTESPSGIVAAWVGNSSGTLQGRLENVTVARGKVSSSAMIPTGGLVGRSRCGTFLNCSFDGVVERTAATTFSNTYYPVGGILGEGLEDVSLSGCTSSGTLTTASGRACGGILGYCSKEINITGCTSTMDINARDDVAGGIAGYYGTGTISGCHVKSDITVYGNGSGKSYIGGIAGHTSGSVVITQCSYTGEIEAYAGVVGGILGQCNAGSGNGCTITQCRTAGTINATATVGGIVGQASNVGFSVSECGSMMDIICTSNYVGGVVGDLPKNSTLRNCFASGNVIGGFGVGGIAGRAFGIQTASASLETSVNITVEGCIAFNTSIKTCVSGGENPADHYSGGVIVGCSSRPNELKNCWRKSDMTFEYYSEPSLNVLFDHEDSDTSKPLTQPSGSAKWYSPYHGKAASAGSTLSAVAQSAGWSAQVWDFSSDIPELKLL